MEKIDYLMEMVSVIVEEVMEKRTGEEIIINYDGNPSFNNSRKTDKEMALLYKKIIDQRIEKEEINVEKELYTNTVLKQLLSPRLKWAEEEEAKAINEKIIKSDESLKEAKKNLKNLNELESFIYNNFERYLREVVKN